MGLFINEKGHPNVFKNNEDIKNQNQEHFKIDPLAEWMKEQKEATETTNRRFNMMENLLKQQSNAQSNRMISIHEQLSELKENDIRRENFEKGAQNSFSKLEDKNQVLLERFWNLRNLNQDCNVQVKGISQSNQEIIKRIEIITSANEEVLFKINEQMNQQQQLSDQFSQHKSVQKDVIIRLDNQEGLLEKVVRQLDNLRSALYERTSFLTRKIEGSYNTTTSRVSKVLSKQEQNSTSFMLNHKQEEKEKNTE